MRRGRGRLTAFALGAMLSASCASSVTVSGMQPGQSIQRSKTYLLYGLVPTSDSNWDPRAECPAGVAKVEMDVGFGRVLLGLLTMGLITGYDVHVRCGVPPTPTASPSAPGAPPAGGSVIIVR